MILDVGCGYKPIGDVNVDKWRLPFESDHTRKDACPLHVQAIGEYLPFRDGSFEIVHSNQVIEHSFNPKLFVDECLRVARKTVIVSCPHRKGIMAVMPFHRWHFDEYWFLSQWKCTYEVSKRPYFPFSISKRNRFLRYGLKKLFPLIRLMRCDNLRVVINK